MIYTLRCYVTEHLDSWDPYIILLTYAYKKKGDDLPNRHPLACYRLDHPLYLRYLPKDVYSLVKSKSASYGLLHEAHI